VRGAGEPQGRVRGLVHPRDDPFFQYRRLALRYDSTMSTLSLANRVAVVTGASRGVGAGVARELARVGARVFATGRTIQQGAGDDGVFGLKCDHTDDRQVEATLNRVLEETGAVDVLVNNVWGGYERMVEDGVFTWPKPFWEQPLWRWDAMFHAGVRAHYHASQIIAPSMIARRRGIIVNISTWAARKYLGNVAYGVAKAATDKMTADMAHEVAAHGVVVVSLYPGLVRTEKVMEAADFLDLSNSESPDFIGRAVAALAADDAAMRHTGKVLVAAELGDLYGFTDIDGASPRPLTLADA
jgi:dehydrogenase/reductase SDR family member 1